VEEPEPGLSVMLDRFPENVIFASDYPHADGTFPGSTKELVETTSLTEPQKQAVLRDNALRLYQL
jgi:predicted TIM-barrel fold metal-dependent hydrolase